MFNGRSAEIRYAKATVHSMPGVILFPDSYIHPNGVNAPANTNTAAAPFDGNVYDGDDWAAMESAGCVFLPASGDRRYNGASNAQVQQVYYVGTTGYYWSTTYDSSTAARSLMFNNTNLNVNKSNSSNRNRGRCVRLVRDVN